MRNLFEYIEGIYIRIRCKVLVLRYGKDTISLEEFKKEIEGNNDNTR